MPRTLALIIALAAVFMLAAAGYVSAQDTGTPTPTDTTFACASPAAGASPEAVSGRGGQVLLASPVASSACASPVAER